MESTAKTLVNACSSFALGELKHRIRNAYYSWQQEQLAVEEATLAVEMYLLSYDGESAKSLLASGAENIIIANSVPFVVDGKQRYRARLNKPMPFSINHQPLDLGQYDEMTMHFRSLITRNQNMAQDEMLMSVLNRIDEMAATMSYSQLLTRICILGTFVRKVVNDIRTESFNFQQDREG